MFPWAAPRSGGSEKKYAEKEMKVYYSMEIYLKGSILPSPWGRFKAVMRTLKDFSRV